MVGLAREDIVRQREREKRKRKRGREKGEREREREIERREGKREKREKRDNPARDEQRTPRMAPDCQEGGEGKERRKVSPMMGRVRPIARPEKPGKELQGEKGSL